MEKGKGKVFYGQEPPSGESTTTECGVNYQLLAVITEAAQWGTHIVAVNHNQLRTMASKMGGSKNRKISTKMDGRISQ